LSSYLLTQEIVAESIDYDPDTGIVTWRERPPSHFTRLCDWATWNAQHSGLTVGHVGKQGYCDIRVFNRPYRLHTLIWLYVHGAFPTLEIDHINGIRSDNRLVNLRDVSRHENTKNQRMRKSNKSGFNGVFWQSNAKKWRAQINDGGKSVHLGYFVNIEDAISARKIANVRYGYHKNHGASADRISTDQNTFHRRCGE